MPSDLQSRPKIRDANQHEKLIERQLVTESSWRYRPTPAIELDENQTSDVPEPKATYAALEALRVRFIFVAFVEDFADGSKGSGRKVIILDRKASPTAVIDFAVCPQLQSTTFTRASQVDPSLPVVL